MRDMVDELVGFSRLRDEQSAFRLHELVGRIVSMHRMAVGSSVRLVQRIDWEGKVCASAAKVEQILANLLSNATDAVPRGRGDVTVAVSEEGGLARISVRDNGPGVDGRSCWNQ